MEAKRIATTSTQATNKAGYPKCLRLRPERENIIPTLAIKSLSLNPNATCSTAPSSDDSQPLPNKQAHPVLLGASSMGSGVDEPWGPTCVPPFSAIQGQLAFSQPRGCGNTGMSGRKTSGTRLDNPGNIQKREDRRRSAASFLWTEEPGRCTAAGSQTCHTVLP